VLLSGGGRARRALNALDRAASAIRPTLFGYQFVYQCEAISAPASAPSNEWLPLP